MKGLEGCPYCDTEHGTTCDYLEPILNKCRCEEYHPCPEYLQISAEIGDSINCALDAWEDKHGFYFKP